MNKRVLISAVSVLSIAMVIGIASVGNKVASSLNIVKADPVSVEHTIRFTYDDIELFEFEGGLCLASLSKKTNAGNDFVSEDVTIYDYSDIGPSKGDSTHQYLFKVNNSGYPYYVYESKKPVSIEFKMNVDIPFSVTRAIANVSTYYDESGDKNPASTSVSTKDCNFDDYEMDEDGLKYDFLYQFEFENKYQYQATINYVEFVYSCTY